MVGIYLNLQKDDDRSAAQGPRAKLHAASEVSDHLLRGNALGHLLDELLLIFDARVDRIDGVEEGLDLIASEHGAEQGSLLGVFLSVRRARVFQELMGL